MGKIWSMGTQRNSRNSEELVGTRGNSWELVGTRGNSWELVGTRGNSWELENGQW